MEKVFNNLHYLSMENGVIQGLEAPEESDPLRLS